MVEIVSTTNPIFRNFPSSLPPGLTPSDSTRRMTFSGAVRKTIILALWTLASAVSIWRTLIHPESVNVYLFGEKFFFFLLGFSCLAPFVLVVLSVWRRDFSPITAPVYAILQGMFFGFVGVGFESRFPGVPMQAFCLTCCTCIALACAYRFGLVRATDHFNKKLMLACFSGPILYLGVAFLLSHAGFSILPIVLHGRSAVICGIIAIFAGVTFISGYDLAARSAEQNHPAYMEWHAALGLILSLVWLYLEGLRILFKDRVPNEAVKA